MKNTFSSPAKFFRGFTMLLAFSLTLLFSCERDKIEIDIEAPAEDLTFQKITKTFASGGKFTTANILANVQGKKTGYTLKVITDLDPSNLVTVSDKKELNFSGGLGNFTATLILEHRAKKDATITNCEFEITRGTTENLSFQKVTKLFVSGGKFTTTDILDGVQGSKTGYTIKEINTLNPNDFATVSTSPTKELNFKNKAGNFTATIILQHPTKKDVTIKKCEFEITNATIPTWEKTFGSDKEDKAEAIVQTKDGGFIVTGATTNKRTHSPHFCVIKLDASGNKMWEKTFGGALIDWANDIIQTKDNGYVVAGYTMNKGAGDYDFWVIKLDELGKIVWEETFGGKNRDEAQSIIQTNDGGFAVAGHTLSKGAGWFDVWVIKLDASGNKMWDKNFGGTESDRAYEIIQTKNGDLVVAGATVNTVNTSYDVLVLKLDSSGKIVWEKTFGGNKDDAALSIIETADNKFMVAGYTDKSVAGSSYNYNAWILKLDASGNKIWDKNFGGIKYERAYDIIQTKDNNFVFAGFSDNNNNAYAFDAWILKLDASGKKIWEKTFGGKNREAIKSIIQTSDGGLAVAGNTNSKGAGNYDIWVLKLDKDGNL